ncbi:hypothetical protein GALMADRAFT_37265, partial [Galerina marginata CBS 339.88]
MRFTLITAITASVAVAVAGPTLENRQSRLCSSSTAPNPVCCATSILGAADLDCASPPNPLPTDIPGFNNVCAAAGQRARCCLLVVV